MTDACCAPTPDPRGDAKGWRSALWIALLLNAAMFAVEVYAGATADSRALMADALDFFADAANYAISLAVAGMALAWRAKAALFKGASLAALGAAVMAMAVYSALTGSSPKPETMGLVGALALAVNLAVAALLYRFRAGDSNMRSVWICSRNDALGNIAVVAAALGVLGTGSHWPDLIVATILASLAITGGWQIVRAARLELRLAKTAPATGCRL